MATHPGLFVTAAGTTAAAARKDLAGLIVRDTTGKPRAGILPAHTGALVTARASISGNLAVDVASFLAVTVRDPAGVEVTVWGNQGTVPVSLPTAAPAANSRIDRIYVKHNDAEMGDANANPVIVVVTGTAAAVPTVPALPAGALPLAQILIPAGVTATTAGGVVITQDHPYTTTAGGTVLARTATEMDAYVAVDGSDVYRLDNSRVYTRRAGVWVPGREIGTVTHLSFYVPPTTWEALELSRDETRVQLVGVVSNNTVTSIAAATNYVCATIPVGWRPAKSVLAPIVASPNLVVGWAIINPDGNVNYRLASALTSVAVQNLLLAFDMSWPRA